MEAQAFLGVEEQVEAGVAVLGNFLEQVAAYLH
jgi:hypothetical protein